MARNDAPEVHVYLLCARLSIGSDAVTAFRGVAHSLFAFGRSRQPMDPYTFGLTLGSVGLGVMALSGFAHSTHAGHGHASHGHAHGNAHTGHAHGGHAHGGHAHTGPASAAHGIA